MKQQWEPPELEEMPVVILSLHQKWWQKMAAGEKVLELWYSNLMDKRKPPTALLGEPEEED